MSKFTLYVIQNLKKCKNKKIKLTILESLKIENRYFLFFYYISHLYQYIILKVS